jgi:hypothetical protein
MERVRFISHKGKQILLIDCTHCSAQEVQDVYEDVKRVVTAQPLDSVLTLSDWTGAQIDKATITYLKEVAVYDRPHVKRAALVGGEAAPRVLFNGLTTFSSREFPEFKTREEALEWLVED